MPPQTSQAEALTEQDYSDADDLSEILEGLSRAQKALSPKYFYDERGSKLFDAICELPEYYLTRTELAIMRAHIADMADLIGPQASIIEFGSGSSLKTRMLLENLDRLAAYVPVDISREHLMTAADALAADYPDIEVWPVLADFMQPFRLPNPTIMPLRNVVYFPGSTIGNFSPDDAHSLLRVMHGEAGEDGALLIGVDLQKDKDVIERAYNDSVGITAEFNLNMLTRINTEFGANFNIDLFRHHAFYNDEHGRIEMYLISECEQLVRIGGRSFRFEKGEALLTEHSHKYTLEQFAGMARRAGFVVDTVWTDPEQLFSVQYCLRV
ncbi:MAG: L-histidine N(alpha)-methyltransferase [Woeseiaceae bacterium]